MQRARPWDVPVLQDKEVELPASLAGFRGICEVEGFWSSFDVYVSAPSDWFNVTFRVVADNMGLDTELDRKLLSDIEHPITGRAISGAPAEGQIVGSLFRITSRPCAKFRVEALSDGTARTGRARVWIRATDPDSVSGDRSGRLQIDPFAARHQQLNFSAIIPAGVTVIPFLPTALLAQNNAAGNRIYITDLLHTTDDPGVQTVTLQTRNSVTAAVTTRRTYLAGGALTVVQDTFSYALRPDRGDDWEVALTATGGTGHFLNLTAFAE